MYYASDSEIAKFDCFTALLSVFVIIPD